MASQLARQLGPRGGELGGSPYSTHKNTPYRLDKSRSRGTTKNYVPNNLEAK